MSLRTHLLVVAVLVAGCENDILFPTAIPAPGPPTATPPTLNARDVAALGSYEIVFDTVTPDDRFSAGSEPLPITPVSIGQRARLDVRASQQPGFIEISITPRWGGRHVYNHSPAVGGALAVGQRGNAITFARGKESDQWTLLRMARRDDGSLDGTFDAEGELKTTADAVNPPRIVGKGRVLPDSSPPEMRLAPPLRSRGGSWLPWDTITLELAEPVAPNKLFERIAPTFPELFFARGSPADSAGRQEVTSFEAAFREAYPSGTRTLNIADLKDPTRNVMLPFTGVVTYHDLGSPRASHDLDETDNVALWGGATRITDARCKSGGCVVFPAAMLGACEQPSGIAGFITTPTPTYGVFARVRILARGEDAAQPALGPAVHLEVAFDKTAPSIPGATLGSAKLSPSGDAELPWQSDWISLSVQAAQPSPTFAFALTRAECDGSSSPPPPPTKVVVIVDEIWAQ